MVKFHSFTDYNAEKITVDFELLKFMIEQHEPKLKAYGDLAFF